MRIVTADRKRAVDIGSVADWICLYSTAEGRLGEYKKKIPLAMDFLREGKCEATDSIETAREINLMRDAFAGLSPDQVIYDIETPEQLAPWINSLSPVITSCANLFTTADGKDMLFEIVSLLTYAGLFHVSVNAERT